jgi:hypothetical protein
MDRHTSGNMLPLSSGLKDEVEVGVENLLITLKP